MGAPRYLRLVLFAIVVADLPVASPEARATDTSRAIVSGAQQTGNDRLITPDAMGPVRLGMTLAQARKAFPAARFERASDGDGAALVSVDFGDADRLVLWADEDDPHRPIDWSRRIVTITTFSKAFHTREGVHPERLVTDVIPIFGPVQEIVVSEIESRRFVTFERQPSWLTFRLDYTGRFTAAARRTKDFEPGTRILGITISSVMGENVARTDSQRPASALSTAWAVLLGDWKGEGGGAPGTGAGGESFRYDLDTHVIIRRGTSDYPAANGRPATHHEDLTVIYPAPSGDAASAVYFDNEGHVINYSASWWADGKTLVFVSTGDARAPQYRLTYTMLSTQRMAITFEVAPPGGPFKTYVTGVNSRVGAP